MGQLHKNVKKFTGDKLKVGSGFGPGILLMAMLIGSLVGVVIGIVFLLG